jgi:shikimate 5-dehydrogenase
VDEAAKMAANARRAALSMFPGKELAYDMIYRPRLQRLINERFRLQ